MSLPRESEKEIEQYGAAVGIALSNGLHEEGLDLAFTRGGGIFVPEYQKGTRLPARAELDANAVGGFDATLTYVTGEKNNLSGITISSYGHEGSVKLEQSKGRITSISADKDGDGKSDVNLRFERQKNALHAIHLDEDNDGKVDAVLSPVSAETKDAPVLGFNVDLGGDGTVDGFAEFVRNENQEVKTIRFRQIK